MRWEHEHPRWAMKVPSAAKVMGTVFWDAEGLILVEFLECGQTITAARYVQTLHKLRCALCDKCPGRNIIILHDNARPHAACLTSEAIAKMGWEVLPHPSYSPDLAPTTIFSDLWMISCVDNVMRQRRQFRKQCVSVFGWLERSSTAGAFSNFQNAGRNVYKEVAIMWKNKESYVD